MTTPSAPGPAAPPSAAFDSSARLRLPGFVVALYVLSPILLLLGAVNFLATEPRDYLERAATQATVGIVMFLVGLALLLAALVLTGVRSIAQQQLDLLRTERDR